MIPQPARRSTSIRWSRDTNTPAGEFVTFTAEELKALDVESSKIVDLEKFVPPDNIDPVYFDSSYYLHSDGPIAVETLRVIGAAMAEARVVGLGRLTLSRRERIVMVEPSGIGMALFTLRAASDVRAPEFGNVEGDLDAEMVAIAGAIIRQRTGHFDPSTYRDRYQASRRSQYPWGRLSWEWKVAIRPAFRKWLYRAIIPAQGRIEWV